MSLLDAVEVVLAESRTPMRADEIARSVIARKLWATTGKTPDRTIGAALYMDIRNHGEDSRFQKVDKGVFNLRAVGNVVASPKVAPEAHARETPINSKREKTLSFNDAAEEVLKHYGDKRPMHYREVTKRALDLGLIHSEGKTPEATMFAQVLTEIARRTKRGETPRFMKHGRGYIGLTEWMGTGLAFQIEQHNAAVRKKLRGQLSAMTPGEFEGLVGELLGALGFEEVTVTGRSGDGGIDVRGTLVVGDVIRTRMAVQVKRWKQNVQAPVIQQVRGSLGTHEQGLIITTSDLSAGARDEAERANAVPVALMNGEQLVAVLVEHNIGVHRNSYDLLELGAAEEE